MYLNNTHRLLFLDFLVLDWALPIKEDENLAFLHLSPPSHFVYSLPTDTSSAPSIVVSSLPKVSTQGLHHCDYENVIYCGVICILWNLLILFFSLETSIP
jgi:hypothetical protein